MSDIPSEQDHQDFQDRGYVKVREAFAPDDARTLEDVIWKRLSKSGVDRDDPGTWGRLVTRLGLHAPASPYGLWLRTLIAINAVALLFDTIDVIRYLRGNRDEMVEGLD